MFFNILLPLCFTKKTIIIMDNSKAKKNLRELRKKANMTQVEMARLLGVKRTTYRNIETGPTKLINDNVFRIADILKSPAEAIISDYDLSGVTPALLCERNEDYERRIMSLQNDLDRRTRENEDLREINQLLREILLYERKAASNKG